MREAACLLALLTILGNGQANGQNASKPPIKQKALDPADEVEQIFRKADRDGDGFLQFEEMSEALQRKRDIYDKNKDGFIDLAEFSVYFAESLAKKGNPPSVERAKTERMLYLVRYGDAKALATTLSQHYKNEADLQIVPDAASNALLVSAPLNLLADLTKTIDQLDRRPRQVMIEVLLVELPVEEEAVIDPKDFEKPIDKILPAFEALSKKGKVNHLRRFQMSALENQKSSLTMGESKPIISGVTGGFGGGGRGGPGMAQNSITYHQVGSVLSATPRVSPDGNIAIDLSFEESRVVVPENGVPLGGGAVAAETPRTTIKGAISVASGRSVLVQGVKTDTKGEKKTQTIVIVGAQVIDK
jgi:type II secretory pathway component GspD/PulD (secretin)